MTRPSFLRLSGIVLFIAAFTGVSHAAGPCSTELINTTYAAVYHKVPAGSGTTGECNPNMYVGSIAHPFNPANAANLVIGAHTCQTDPWIGEIYLLDHNMGPQGFDPQKCLIIHYNNGQWRNNQELGGYIQAYLSNPIKTNVGTYDRAPRDGWIIVDNSKYIRDSQGRSLSVLGLQVFLDNKAYSPNPGDVLRIVSQSNSTAGGPSVAKLYLSRN